MSSNIIIDALRGSSAYVKEADKYRSGTMGQTTTTVDTLLMREQNSLLRANHALLVAILSNMSDD